MVVGELYRFRDNAFGKGHYQRLNGLPFLVVKRVPPQIEGMSHGVSILVGDEVEFWSERVLLKNIEVKEV